MTQSRSLSGTRKSIGRPKKRRTRHAVISKPIAQMVFDVRNHFQKEKTRERLLISLNNVVARAAAATNTSMKTACKLKSQTDVDKCENDTTGKRTRLSVVPLFFKQIVRTIIRDIIIEDKTLPTLNTMHQRLSAGNFTVPEYLALETQVNWKWTKETLRRFLRPNDFEYGKRHNNYTYRTHCRSSYARKPS